MSIAFFDFDETLIVGNSGRLWVRRELRSGHITRAQALRAAAWMVRYRMGFATMEDALRTAIRSLRGTPEETIRRRTREFYEEEVRPLYRGGARRAVALHRGRGEACVLLTASSLYLSELVRADLGLDDVLCTRFQVQQGVHTGEPEGWLCFGAGKLRYAEEYAAGRGVELDACTFYTDSYSDLPVLERVGCPVVVNPDRRLRRVARRRGWQAVEWGGPAAPGAAAGHALG
ncbi:MAG TPA: HAD family hydrolase [Myxococcaceae bacterium]|nr:HAD family hydrolase [Myxococcaceae bacterium]